LKSLLIIILWFLGCDDHHTENISSSLLPGKNSKEETGSARIKSYASDAKDFCYANGCNTKLFFLIDMSVHSGRKRFFVYDMRADSVLCSSMVAHGACGHSFLNEAQFSNQPGSGCTSIGKYKIGAKYNGRFGIAYKLYGLDSSDSNAYERCVVLHSYYEVPDDETFPDPICNSLGCPMVSPNFLSRLEIKIDASSKPILLWIIN
jgi:hypothetical protein